MENDLFICRRKVGGDSDGTRFFYYEEISPYKDDLAALKAAVRDLGGALRELRAVVKGECPSLLNEDSGGDAELDFRIDEALSKHAALIEAEGE